MYSTAPEDVSNAGFYGHLIETPTSVDSEVFMTSLSRMALLHDML
jgi:hypothetical protein